MTKRVPGLVPLFHLWIVTSFVVISNAVRRDQGVPDTRAFVGRIFTMQIPANAFEGNIERFEATEAGESSLPVWLEFDSVRKTFQGVPNTTDSGQLYVCIKTIDGETSAKDVFSIDVMEDGSTDSYCPFGKDETLTTIVIDATLPEMKPKEKLRILQSLASFLNIPEPRIKITPLRKDESSFDPSSTRAGPGNTLQRKHDGAQIQFNVGCSGDVSSEFEGLISNLEKSAANGELSDLVGCMIVGWQVSGAMRPVEQIRDKRNVPPYHATPVLEMHVKRWPTYTRRVDGSETRENIPSRRIVPTMSSPHFVARITYDHKKHRHHHGQDPLRREHIYPTSEVQASPTYRYHSIPTAGFLSRGTPLPTPILYPDRPTTMILPTRVYDVDGTATATQPGIVFEDVLSRWYVPSSDVSTADIRPTRSQIVVEPTRIMTQVPNFKPTVNRRTKKLSLVAGKVWTYTIPIDTFIDVEDGNTRDLKLIFMTSEHSSLTSFSWIQFDPEKQMIYALPLSENIGKHEFVLEAMDSKGASTFDRVELHVWPHPQADTLTHSFTMTVRYKKWLYPVSIDWQIEMLNKLAQLFNDTDNSNLRLLSVTLDPAKMTWTNDTLPTEYCPNETIKKLYETIATSEHHATKEVRKLMGSDFRVQDIFTKFHGSCQSIATSPAPPLNFAPIVRNPIDRINVTVGDIIKYRIPENTFYDFEDGGTRQLRLTLLTSDNIEPQMSYWLQFDQRNQEIYGLASEKDIGMYSFQLNAVDSDEQSFPHPFVIQVSRLARHKKPPVEFSIQLDYDYETFQSDTNRKTLVASRIARLYGDPDPRYILINNITRGSVVYVWSNKTLANEDCPVQDINRLVRYIIGDDGNVSSNLIHIMEPEFRVIGADAKPVRMCVGRWKPSFVTTIVTSRGTTTQPSLTPGEIEPTLKTSTDDDIYITTVVPAIVIAVMLIIAAIVAYFLYWRKRNGKMNIDDKDFIGSGVPVVFAGELEEQKPDLGKTPAIMPNEKPPLSTDYLLNPFRRGTAAVRDSVLAATSAKTRDDTPLRERQDSSTLYKPPPPFASSREPKNTRPKSTQAYRHATYVPP